MSLDNIQLPGFVLQALFTNNLVDLNCIENNQTTFVEKEINIFGGNKKNILLLINNPDIAFVTEQQLNFISGILSACKLILEDIGLINTAPYPQLSHKDISDNFNPKICILFGIVPAALQLPFVIPEFQVQSFSHQVYLTAPPLDILENNIEMKRKFWALLQQIFSI